MNPARNPRLLVLCALAALAIAGPWAWFHVAAPAPKTAFWLATDHRPEGYRYAPEPLSNEVLGLLATTNVVNGSFVGTERNRRITVFRADWLPTEGIGKTVVNHTPDVCWVGIGWKPVNVGQPVQLPLKLGDTVLPFECRVFEAPTGGTREMTLWCTLVNGEVLPETFKFDSGDRRGGRLTAALNLSRLAVSRFWERIKRRAPANGHKQFVRYSMPYGGDLQATLGELERFGTQWLSVQPLTQGH